MVEFRETWRDGSSRSEPGIRYKNPTQGTIALRFLREPAVPRRDERDREWLPNRYLDVRVAPGETVILPASVATEIHQTICRAPDCRAHNKLYCRDPAHDEFRQVCCGLAPQLTRLRDDGSELAMETQPGVLPEPPLPPHEIDDLHTRTMARIARMKGGAA
jgi:hypothetical protein